MRYPGPFFLDIRIHEQNETSREAYDEIYALGDLSQIKSFYHWFLGLIPLKEGGRFLDVSCGAGEVIDLASRAGQLAVGIDISAQAAQLSKARVKKNGSVAVCLGESLPFASRSFDTITNIGSLEHFVDPVLGVQEMRRVIKTGGRAYILVPNTYSLLENVWNAMRSGETSYDEQPIQRYGARKDWTVLLEQNGLKVVDVIKYERIWPRSQADWQYLFRHPKEFIRLLATPFLPTNLAYAFIFICECS